MVHCFTTYQMQNRATLNVVLPGSFLVVHLPSCKDEPAHGKVQKNMLLTGKQEEHHTKEEWGKLVCIARDV